MKKKEWWQSKTVWIALLNGALGVVVTLKEVDVNPGGLLLIEAGLMLALRVVTTKGLNL